MKYIYTSAEFDQKMCSIFNVDYVEKETTRISLEKITTIKPCNLGIDIGVFGKDPWNKGKKTRPLSESHKKALSLAAKSHKRTEEHIRNNALANCKSWLVTDPTGNAFIIKNMNEFCKNNGLSAGHMTMISQGKRKQHKGWTCSKIKE